MLKSTKQNNKYWAERKIDWKTSYFDTLDHPHRSMLAYIIKSMPFFSLWEVGVGGGANLAKFIKDIKKPMQLGGSDINPDAVAFCNQAFKGGIFHLEPGNNLMMSDKSVDLLLSDMTLIYIDPLQIDSYLAEFKRVTRNYVVLCEFHSESFFKRLRARLNGYHVYNYKKLLAKHGFYDVIVQRIPPAYWPGTDKNTEFRSIITART